MSGERGSGEPRNCRGNSLLMTALLATACANVCEGFSVCECDPVCVINIYVCVCVNVYVFVCVPVSMCVRVFVGNSQCDFRHRVSQM